MTPSSRGGWDETAMFASRPKQPLRKPDRAGPGVCSDRGRAAQHVKAVAFPRQNV